MREFKQSIYPELSELGGCRVLEGTLDEGAYEVGGMQLQVLEGVDYKITLTNTSEAILAQGSVWALVQTECARCLELTQLEVEGEVQGYFLLDPGQLDDGYEPDEVEAVDAEGNLDLSGVLMAALAYSTPFIILCKDDCKGLCPKCGCNLNEESCNCSDEPDPLNPFAALMGMDFSDEDRARGEQAAEEFGTELPSLEQEDEFEQLSAEDEAAIEAALDAFFADDEAAGSLEFDDDGNLIFIPGGDEGEAE